MIEAPGQEMPPQQVHIQKIYVKDMSFETPNSPAVFLEKWEPEVSLQLSNSASALNDSMHEVILLLTVTAKIKDKTAYLVEVHQAGIFGIEGYDETQASLMIGSYCPGVLYPYAREAVSNLVTRGGFPQLVLAPINFDALYYRHMEQFGRQVPERTDLN